MNKRARMCTFAVVVTLAACAALTYMLIDRSISMSYLDQSYVSENRSKIRLETLLSHEWRGAPEAEVLRKLEEAAARTTEPRPIVKKEGATIWFDEVKFNIVQGRLASVGDKKVGQK